MRVESIFLITLMLLVPVTHLVGPGEATSARSQPHQYGTEPFSRYIRYTRLDLVAAFAVDNNQ